jgi:hypothetical protein
MDFFVERTANGGMVAMRWASSVVAASSWPIGTTRLTSPRRYASCADSASAVQSISFALRGPTSQGSTRSCTPSIAIVTNGIAYFYSDKIGLRPMRSYPVTP